MPAGRSRELRRALTLLNTYRAGSWKDQDPRLREMAVRMLGRDCRENGKVEYSRPEAKQPPAAVLHLETLKGMAGDPDAGVRRELILAFRNLPTDSVGDSLRRLAATWDGQDRWYLEALGLAIEKRDGSFLSTLFDGSLYGELDLEHDGKNGNVAVPPYFPVDRNEAFIATGTPERAVSAVSKYLGLAWRIHRHEVLPLIERMLPKLRAVELQQATDDILDRMSDPETAELVANMAVRMTEPGHKKAMLMMLARRLGGNWSSASGRPQIVKVIEGALADPETRRAGIALAIATRDVRFRDQLKRLAKDVKSPEEIRVAAVEGLGSFSRSL